MDDRTDLSPYVGHIVYPYIVATKKLLTDTDGYLQNLVVNASSFVATAQAAATAASTASDAASQHATDAGNSATASAASESASNTVYQKLVALFASFSKTWYGVLAADPTTDPNGDPPIAGAEYFNSTTNTIRYYDGSKWADTSTEASNMNQSAAMNASYASQYANAAKNSETNAAAYAAAAAASAQQSANSYTQVTSYLSTIVPPSSGIALDYVRINAAGTAYEARTPAQVLSDIGGISNAILSGIVSGTLGYVASNNDQIGRGLHLNGMNGSPIFGYGDATNPTWKSLAWYSDVQAETTRAQNAEAKKLSSSGGMWTGDMFANGWAIYTGTGYGATTQGSRIQLANSGHIQVLTAAGNVLADFAMDPSGNSITFNSPTNVNGYLSMASDILLNGHSITSVPGAPHVSFESNGNISYWNSKGTAMGYWTGASASPTFMLNVPLSSGSDATFARLHATGINFTTSGGCSIYQDSGNQNIVFQTTSGSNSLYSWFSGSDFILSDHNLTVTTGFAQAKRFIAGSGIGGMNGLTFDNDTAYNTGVMSNGVGNVGLYVSGRLIIDTTFANNALYTSLNAGTISASGNLNLLGHLSTNNDIFLNGCSIRTANGNSRLTLEAGGNISMWDSKNNLVAWMATANGSVLNYNFNSAVIINNTLSVNTIAMPNNGNARLGGVELYADNPFIHFHRGNNDAINASIDNQADQVLTFTANNGFIFNGNGNISFSGNAGQLYYGPSNSCYLGLQNDGNAVFYTSGGAAVAVNDASTTINNTLYANGSVHTSQVFFSGGSRTSSIYQDTNAGNIVFHTNDGTNDHYFQIESDGTFNIQNVNANGSGYLQGGRILAANGGPGGMCGFTFINEGSYDSGLFSPSDGIIHIVRDGNVAIELVNDGAERFNLNTGNAHINGNIRHDSGHLYQTNGEIFLNGYSIFGGSDYGSNQGSHIRMNGGHIEFWDPSGNLMAYFGGGDNPDVFNLYTGFNSNQPVTTSNWFHGTGLMFNNGGTSSIYQDSNTNDVVIAINNQFYTVFNASGGMTSPGVINCNALGAATNISVGGAVFTNTVASPNNNGTINIQQHVNVPGNITLGGNLYGTGSFTIYNSGASVLATSNNAATFGVPMWCSNIASFSQNTYFYQSIGCVGDINARYLNGSQSVGGWVNGSSPISEREKGWLLRDGHVYHYNVNQDCYTMGQETQGYAFIMFWNGTTTIGSIVQNGYSVGYNTTSDYRTKENVSDLSGDKATQIVRSLRPVEFDWIGSGDETPRHTGFIAHEVQDHVPQAVSGTKDGLNEDGTPRFQGIDLKELVPHLTKALQGALEQIDQLTARVAALESKIS